MEEKNGSASDDSHVHHDGFPLPRDDNISWIHRLTRTRVGVVLFLLVVLACSSLTACFYPPTFIFILNTGLVVSHVQTRRFADYAVGCWIYALAVSRAFPSQYSYLVFLVPKPIVAY